jgi:uncharacterized protein YuzE
MVRRFTTPSLIADFRSWKMKVKYFPDTDTLLVNFSSKPIVDSHDLNEDVLIELDEKGCVVSMTIEHAKQQTDVGEFSYQLGGAV